MLNNTYYRNLTAFIIALVAIIIGFSAIIYTHGPRVRSVIFDNDPTKVSLTENSTITIRFDRPLKAGDYSRQIHISPEVAFTTKTSAQNITVRLLGNFHRATEYSLEIGPDILDKTGKSMSGIYEQTFKTTQPSFMYLERNYGPDSNKINVYAQDDNDYLKLATLGKQPVEIFSNPNITMFAANRDYAVVATMGKEKDKLYTVNLASKEIREEKIPFEGKINYLTMSARGNIALFTVTPDYRSVTSEYYNRVSSRVESLDVETGETRPLTTAGKEHLRASSIYMSRDGQVALIQDPSHLYYAASPFNDYDPIVIGTFTTSFGFGSNPNEILFQDKANFVLYDTLSGDDSLIDFNLRGYVSKIIENNNKLYIASSAYVADKPHSYIHSINKQNGASLDLVWSNSDKLGDTLQDFSLSYDGELIALQLSSNNCVYDRVATNPQCQDARIAMYDTRNKEATRGYKGSNLVWLP